MLIGQQAPSIRGQAIVNGKITDITLEDFAGKYKVLFFYPLDFTFVCPTELHAFQEALQDFQWRNTEVLGISVDSIYSHQAWLLQPKAKGGIEGIAYPLISDITKQISRDYGVLDEKTGVAYRGIFIIDKNNTIQSNQINNLSLGRNINEVLRLIDALLFIEEHGEVCPANWKQGDKGLNPTQAGVVDYFHNK